MMKNSKMSFFPFNHFEKQAHKSFSFTIPELPSGQQLVVNLKTTWGDRHYIGLNGIEIYSSQGYPVTIKRVCEFD